MQNIKDKKARVATPSREVWRKQMAKGIYSPHRVSRITCIVNHLIKDRVSGFLKKLGVIAYIEQGRAVREFFKSQPFGLPGNIIQLQNSSVDIFRFTVPRETSGQVIEQLVKIADLHIPGRGTVFAQDLIEFSKEPFSINHQALSDCERPVYDLNILKKLSYVVCVLSLPGSGENLARIALDLGICVPVVTFASGNDIRDQLGLIRITISPEKEIVHLIMPEQDSDSIIRLLVEQAKLDRPGRGYIYQTPVGMGLLDTRLKTGKQRHAASMEQIIAAIDSLKTGTAWRKRLDANGDISGDATLLPQDNCEISIISDEDRIDKLREACLSVGATGATTSRVTPEITGDKEVNSNMIRSAISVPADKINEVVDALLEVSTIREENTDRIHVLDSPAAYVHEF
jgi:nitrogen regulatory protein PII